MTNWNPDRVRVDIARDLRAIKDMFDRLREAAINRANDRDLPGGDAMIMLGPIADVEAFGYMRMSEVMGRIDVGSVEEMLKDDVVPPLLFLAGWSDIVRQARNQPTDLKATIAREVDYLRGSIDWMFSTDEYGEMVFLEVDDFASGLHGVVRAMENVLHEGERVDRGAPCLQCATPLVKHWEGDDEDPATEDDDWWSCPNRDCDVQRVEGDELNLAVKATALQYAEWLTASDMQKVYRVPVGTVQGWAGKRDDEGRPFVRKRRDPNVQRMVYSVKDVLARRDEKASA